MKKQKAITLISLVITIVVLIILASVSIYLSLGNNGIFIRAKEAKEATNKQEATDIINLKITTAQMNKYAEKQEMPTLKELSEELRDDSEIQYVTETSKVAVAEYDVTSQNPTSIYTKLNKYPYEFEINSSLQLASINGIKISTGNIATNNGGINYKTDGSEFKTNDTLDGKPVYAKYVETQISSTGRKSKSHNIENVDRIWIDIGNSYCHHSQHEYGLISALPFIDVGTTYQVDSNFVYTLKINDNWSNQTVNLLLKYTKTID